MSKWARKIVVKGILSNVDVYANVQSNEDVPGVSNVTVTGFGSPMPIQGVVALRSSPIEEGFEISGVDSPVEIRGNLTPDVSFRASNVIISNVVAPVRIIGNVGFEPNAGLRVSANSITTKVAIKGNVGFSENSVARAVISEVREEIEIVGNVALSNRDDVFEASVIEIQTAIPLEGNVDLYVEKTSDDPITIDRIVEPVEMKGTFSTNGGIDAVALDAKFDVPVEVSGNAFVDPVAVRYFEEPLRVVGNMKLVGNSVFSKVENPVEIYGNVYLTSQITVTDIMEPFVVNGNINCSGGNLVATNVLSVTRIYGNAEIVESTANSFPQKTPVKTNVTEYFASYEDAQSRIRTSKSKKIVEVRHAYSISSGSKNAVFYRTNNGTLTEDSKLNAAVFTIASSTFTPTKATMRSKRIAVPQIGSTMLAVLGFSIPTPSSNVETRVGYFDEYDGIYFSHSAKLGSRIVARKSNGDTYSEISVSKSSWNVDAFDGTGPSKANLAVNLSNVFFVELDWTPTVRARCGFYINGKFCTAHVFGSQDLLSNPNLPIMWQSYTAELNTVGYSRCLGGTVFSDGWTPGQGVLRSAESSRTVDAWGTSELLSIRIKSSLVRYATITPVRLCVSGVNCRWYLCVNPSDATGGTWVDMGASTSVTEYNVSRSASSGSPSGSTSILASGKTASAFGIVSKPVAEFRDDYETTCPLGVLADGTSDVVSVVVVNYAGASSSISCSLTWRETY